MASLTTDARGNRRIQFVDPTAPGGRRSLSLGPISKQAADGICGYVERLASAKRYGVPIDSDAAGWLAKIGAELHERIVQAGLATPRAAVAVVTLAAVVDTFTAARGASVKPGTRLVYAQARRHLVAAFGADRPATSLTPADADDFRRKLRAEYSEAYTAKMTIAAKSFFRDAVRRKTLAETPFADTATGSQRNPERSRFIDAATIVKCIDAAPDAEWRLLIALARFGGLRVPSEPLGLTWADVNWDAGTMRVHSPKTERHTGGAVRVVPLFAELLPFLRETFELADEGAEHVIVRRRGGAMNLRTQFTRIITRAGCTPWPRLWQNLRASRATELLERFPSHVCAAWLGHTEAVADKHYRQVTATHLAAAVGPKPEAADGADAVQIPTHEAVAVQIPTQQTAATNGKGRKSAPIPVQESHFLPAGAAECGRLRGNPWERQDSNL